MITNYLIKDNILYLYLDYNYEFSYIDLKNNIKKYIESKKIIFTGSTVAIVVGGFIIGNILLNNNSKKDIINNNITYKNINLVNSKVIDLINNNNFDINISEEKVLVNNEKDTNKKTEENKQIILANDVNINNIKNTDINVNIKTNETNNSQTIIEKKINDELNIDKINEQSNNEIYVNIYRSNGEVLKLELEEYLIGCVGAEMPAEFNIEALKAQAIIARTYALKSISRNKILTDTEATQSYKSTLELKNLWKNKFDNYYNKIKEAVISTSGEYLSYNNDYIEAVYHSTSNGITESSVNVWGNYYPYLINVESYYDSESPTYIQNKFISYEELSEKLDIDINNSTEIIIMSWTTGNRVEYVKVGNTILKGIEFRNKLGLRSNDFDLSIEDRGVLFTTRGYGHGVGLSQYGANGMAKNGYNYIEILMNYYVGVKINKL